MNGNTWVRRAHRWLSMTFTVTVVVTVVAIAVAGQEGPAEWIYYVPLLPLALLLPTGLYLFVLPYAAKRRSRR
ncbi:hypothetical protein [Nonomuraea sp. C10]|uniref:hypothetical protein n=1 Tax=Nonomuraea sp. C10 TaxID=2600577 RepID=UPI0011CE0540|nr:hypothetical protein [Nonomuraea sp. C10]TXK41605.1 hypothetical protein FR742_20350 [Nonomuraea sp. C10]